MSQKDDASALETLQYARTHGIRMDARGYMPIVRLLAESKQFEKADQVIELMKTDSVELNSASYAEIKQSCQNFFNWAQKFSGLTPLKFFP